MKYTGLVSLTGLALASASSNSNNIVPEEHKIAFRQLIEGSQETTQQQATCGSEMKIFVNNYYKPFELFIDGEKIADRTSVGTRNAKFTYQVIGDEDIVLGIASNYPEEEFAKLGMTMKEDKGLQVEIELCNERVTTSYEWICSDLKPSGNTWTTSIFDTDTWRQARILKKNEENNDNNNNNNIWSKPCGEEYAKEAYCRVKIPNTCTNPCVRAEVVVPEEKVTPELSCLETCNESMTEVKDYCDRYNHVFTSDCHTCSSETEAWVKQDCRASGCDYEDCALEKPLGSFDMSCFDDCTEGMNDAVDTCAAQSFMLTSSTCGQDCSASIRQFARNNCQRKGCSRIECDLPTFEPTPTPTMTPTIAIVEEPVALVPATPAPTPDVTCFAGCLFGANRIEDECEKIDFTLNSGCSKCPPATMEWARSTCPNRGCTDAQCGI